MHKKLIPDESSSWFWEHDKESEIAPQAKKRSNTIYEIYHTLDIMLG
jgi:hypothetical protein